MSERSTRPRKGSIPPPRLQQSPGNILQQFSNEHQEDIAGDLARKISELSDLHLRYTYSNTSSTSQFGLYEQSSSMEQLQQKFVKDQELFEDILAKVNEVKKILFYQNNDLCLYLFWKYDWSLQKLYNFFDEDWQQFKIRATTYHPQSILKHAIKGTCGVCLTQTKLYSSGMCHHRYCQNCWKGYILTQLQAGRIFFGCMHEKPCRQAPVLKEFVKVLAPELRMLYRKKICVSYCVKNKDISYCPNDKCPYFCSKHTLLQLSMVLCPCGQFYCFKCQNQYHAPVPCRDVQRWLQLINSQNTNLTWIKNHTRQCPKCKQPIQKKVGCSHMKCICQCQFCYECNKQWDKAHQAMKVECPNRKLLQKRAKRTNRVVDLADYLGIMMKQADNHQNSLKLCETLVKDEETIQNKVKSVKVQVICAWMAFKWTKILMALENRPDIEKEFQEDFITSIRNTMEPVEYIIKNISSMSLKDLHHYGEMVLVRKEILKKNKNVWLEAFEANSSNSRNLFCTV